MPPRITRLREARGAVTVELDGRPWRTLPVDVAAAAFLAEGVELDRERACRLARALRRRRSLDTALRALKHRDLTRRALDERLARRGAPPAERAAALDTLARAGLVDDERVAAGRARALAARGRGDEAIRWQLEQEGVAEAVAAQAVAALEPEQERAAAIVARRGPGPATARLLARRGFGEDAVAAAGGAAP